MYQAFLTLMAWVLLPISVMSQDSTMVNPQPDSLAVGDTTALPLTTSDLPDDSLAVDTMKVDSMATENEDVPVNRTVIANRRNLANIEQKPLPKGVTLTLTDSARINRSHYYAIIDYFSVPYIESSKRRQLMFIIKEDSVLPTTAFAKGLPLYQAVEDFRKDLSFDSGAERENYRDSLYHEFQTRLKIGVNLRSFNISVANIDTNLFKVYLQGADQRIPYLLQRKFGVISYYSDIFNWFEQQFEFEFPRTVNGKDLLRTDDTEFIIEYVGDTVAEIDSVQYQKRYRFPVMNYNSPALDSTEAVISNE